MRHGHITAATRDAPTALAKRWGRVVAEFGEGKFRVRMFQNRRRKKITFTVLYGLEYLSDLTYPEAGEKFGLAVMHYQSCNGMIIPEEDE